MSRKPSQVRTNFPLLADAFKLLEKMGPIRQGELAGEGRPYTITPLSGKPNPLYNLMADLRLKRISRTPSVDRSRPIHPGA
jgi:hypothetical protein